MSESKKSKRAKKSQKSSTKLEKILQKLNHNLKDTGLIFWFEDVNKIKDQEIIDSVAEEKEQAKHHCAFGHEFSITLRHFLNII